MKLAGFVIGLLFVVSCSQNVEESLRESIQLLENELKNTSVNDVDKVAMLKDSLVGELLNYYRKYPNDPYAPECLDKVHFIYSSQMNYVEAAMYADTLINKYPDYINRPMVIESQYNNYDMFIKPRNIDKAKYYLELLLKEDKEMDKERRADFEYRLEYIDLTIEQLMERDMTELN